MGADFDPVNSVNMDPKDLVDILQEKLEREISKGIQLTNMIYRQSKVIEELEGDVEILQGQVARLITRAEKAEEAHVHHEFESGRHAED